MTEKVPTRTVQEPAKRAVRTMRAVEWHGTDNVRVVDRPMPAITETTDALIRVTSTSICGSDLHLYHNEIPGMKPGDVLGHEFMGFVEDVGSGVKQLKQGDRVVCSAVIACGECWYCKQGWFSCCDTTNPSVEMEKLYGHRTAGMFGYSHLTGGYDGGQAEYVRVPLADVNCLKITNESLPDEKVLFLSDTCCTGWHANKLGQVKKDSTVAIWGCGPVGLMAAAWAKFRGARQVICIDCVPYRLAMAKAKLGCDVIDFAHENPIHAVQQLAPGGPDVVIDCVGFRYAKSLTHKFMRALKLEHDTPEVLEECINTVRKCGFVSVVGDYVRTANNFPIGAATNKALTMRGGQVFVQKYWKKLLAYIENEQFDPTFIITHQMPLEKAPEAYKMFDQKEDNAIKIILKPVPSRT